MDEKKDFIATRLHGLGLIMTLDKKLDQAIMPGRYFTWRISFLNFLILHYVQAHNKANVPRKVHAQSLV